MKEIEKLEHALDRVLAKREAPRPEDLNHAERDRELYRLELAHFIYDSARLDRLIEDIAEYSERAATVKTANETDRILDELMAKRFPKEATE